MAFDGTHNLLYAANADGTITKIALGANGPTVTPDFVTGLNIDPRGLAVDAAGDLYAADFSNGTILKIDPSVSPPSVKTFAQGLDSFATNALVLAPMTFDAAGNLYVGYLDKAFRGAIAKVTPSGTVLPFASASTALNFEPFGLGFDPNGILYVAGTDEDQGNSLFGEVTPSGKFVDGVNGGYVSIAIDSAGNVYTADGSSVLQAKPPFDTTTQITVQSSVESLPMTIGNARTAPSSGIYLTDDNLNRFLLASNGNITFGDPAQIGDITFADVSGIHSLDAGTSLTALQSTRDGGAIVLDNELGTAPAISVAANGGTVTLTSGTGGIVEAPTNQQGTADINDGNLNASWGVTLTSAGVIGAPLQQGRSAGPLQIIAPDGVFSSSVAGTTVGGHSALNFFIAANSASGDISLTNDSLDNPSFYGDALELDGISEAGTGKIFVANKGDIIVSAASYASPLTISNSQVTLYATGNLELQSGVEINSGGGTTTLDADIKCNGSGASGTGALLIDAGAQVYGGTINLFGASENVDGAATVGSAKATVDNAGNDVAATMLINIKSSDDSEAINVGAAGGIDTTGFAMAPGSAMQIGDNGQSGDVAVTFGALPAPFQVVNGSPAGTVNVYGTGVLDVNALKDSNNVTKTGNNVDWTEGSDEESFNFNGFAHEYVILGPGNDTVLDPGLDTTILGGPGHDTIYITASYGNGVTVNSGSGSDDVIVTLGQIAAPVTFVQPSSTSTNTLTVVAPTTSSSIGVTSSQVTSGTQAINYPSTISSVTIATGTASTSVNVASTTAAGVTVQNQGGTTSTAVTLGSLAGPVNVTGTGTTSVAVSAPTGNNTIAVSGSGVQSGSQTVNVSTTITSLAVDTGSGNNSVSVSNLGSTVQNLAVNSGSGTTNVTLDNVGSSAPPITVTAGTGTTQLQVVGTPPPQLAVNTSTVVTSDHPNGSLYGQSVIFTATVTSNVIGGGTPTGSVQFVVDGKNFGPAEMLTGGAASLSISSLLAGPHTVVAQYTSNSTSFLNSASNPGFSQSVGVANSIYVLNPTASGALSMSGNASIKLPGGGDLFVDSNSASAIKASGTATVTASGILVVGGINKSGQAQVAATGTPAATGDPFAALPAPNTAGLTNFGAVSVSGSTSKTINPGIYSQITVSGSATLTMNPGTYIIEGGGMTVSGSASVSGSGVFIFNAGSAYTYNTTTGTATDGGNFGGITLSGNGKFTLSGPTSGTYAGIVIDQARDNTRAISLGGNATSGITSTIYAANALLTVSGNAQLSGSVMVGTLNLSGNVALTQMAVGSDGQGDIAGIADTLLAGNLYVYVDNSSGGFTSDELARINDAINTWNTLLVPYSVSVVAVTDPTLANVVIDTGTTSASGDAADGVLGCFNSAASEVTLVSGWNWYAGADASQIGADQYDFQTTVTHEIGHALGLGGGTDPSSPMFESLAAGVAHRLPTVADLNIPEPPEGADPQMAAGFGELEAVSTSTAPNSANDASTIQNPKSKIQNEDALTPALSQGAQGERERASADAIFTALGQTPNASASMHAATALAGSEPLAIFRTLDAQPAGTNDNHNLAESPHFRAVQRSFASEDLFTEDSSMTVAPQDDSDWQNDIGSPSNIDWLEAGGDNGDDEALVVASPAANIGTTGDTLLLAAALAAMLCVDQTLAPLPSRISKHKQRSIGHR